MDIHKNARLTPYSRAEMVRRVLIEGQTPEAVATAFGVCPKTARKWVERFQTEGEAGLQDRSSRPHHLRRPTPPETVTRVATLRRQRWTGEQIAKAVEVSPATVSRILKRLGLNKLKALEPIEPVRRYERENPGELIHLDIKSSAGSALSDIASPGDILVLSIVTTASAGSSSMSASMMPRGSPSCRC